MEQIKNIIQASIETKNQILASQEMLEKIQAAVDVITAALLNGNKLLFCGNGGSAADAQHLAAEFSGRFYKDRKAWPAEALHTNTSYLTAVANDYSFDLVYSRLIEGIARHGDVVIGMSTSGNSQNSLNALQMGKKMGLSCIGFTGVSGGKMKELCQILLNVPSDDTPRIQESHIMLGHIICQLVEENICRE